MRWNDSDDPMALPELPPTYRVRNAWVRWFRSSFGSSKAGMRVEFDKWLQAVTEAAWNEGYDEARRRFDRYHRPVQISRERGAGMTFNTEDIPPPEES